MSHGPKPLPPYQNVGSGWMVAGSGPSRFAIVVESRATTLEDRFAIARGLCDGAVEWVWVLAPAARPSQETLDDIQALGVMARSVGAGDVSRVRSVLNGEREAAIVIGPAPDPHEAAHQALEAWQVRIASREGPVPTLGPPKTSVRIEAEAEERRRIEQRRQNLLERRSSGRW